MSKKNTAPANEAVRGRGRPRKYPYPAQLICSVTGVAVKTNPTQMAKQLKDSGLDLETFVKTYVCRSARRQIKEGRIKVDAGKVTTTPAPVTVPVTVDVGVTAETETTPEKTTEGEPEAETEPASTDKEKPEKRKRGRPRKVKPEGKTLKEVFDNEPVKRGRGRPRKNLVAPVVKKHRGRPRKNPVAVVNHVKHHRGRPKGSKNKKTTAKTDRLETIKKVWKKLENETPEAVRETITTVGN